jgi:guanine deaminase
LSARPPSQAQAGSQPGEIGSDLPHLYTVGMPCPMCMGAIYWARLDSVRFASDLEATSELGFDDSFQDEDFDRPLEQRRIDVAQLRPDLGERAYRAWPEKPDRHHY